MSCMSLSSAGLVNSALVHTSTFAPARPAASLSLHLLPHMHKLETLKKYNSLFSVITVRHITRFVEDMYFMKSYIPLKVGYCIFSKR